MIVWCCGFYTDRGRPIFGGKLSVICHGFYMTIKESLWESECGGGKWFYPKSILKLCNLSVCRKCSRFQK